MATSECKICKLAPAITRSGRFGLGAFCILHFCSQQDLTVDDVRSTLVRFRDSARQDRGVTIPPASVCHALLSHRRRDTHFFTRARDKTASSLADKVRLLQFSSTRLLNGESTSAKAIATHLAVATTSFRFFF
jgi:hypothetical protein